MDDYSSSTAYSEQRGRGTSKLDSYQRELARQLSSVDQRTFHEVKQAVQSVVQQQSGSSSLQNLIQVRLLQSKSCLIFLHS